MKISNSQIISLQKCGKRFEYEHVRKLRPKEFPDAMRRGIEGHEMLEAAFKCMQDGGDYDACLAKVNELLPQYIGTSTQGIYRHVLALVGYVFQQEWEVVSVEESRIYDTGITYGEETLKFAFTPDAIFRFTKGPNKGYEFIVDFKFTGQYWSDREINVFQQLPKYIVYTNLMENRNIRHAAIIMLNTRASVSATGRQLFMVKWLPITKEKLNQIQIENEYQMKAVARTKDLQVFTRTADTYSCKLCIFGEDLCPMEMNGRDVTKTQERNYEVNTYFDENYSKDENGPETITGATGVGASTS